jgi:alpha-amylase/alpha-mannosidase (GH57 family)
VVFRENLGFELQDCWPSEGAVSETNLKYLVNRGFRCAASGENVLRSSFAASRKPADGAPDQTYRWMDTPITMFFRDNKLSHLIGFTYSTWHTDDAVANLMHCFKDSANGRGASE